MKNKPLAENITELNDSLKNYVNARIDLWKIILLEKITKTGTYFFTALTVFLAISFILLFLTFAFSFWYGENYGSISEGFLIAAGFNLILLAIVILLRKTIFSNNIIKNVSEIMFSDEEENSLK